MEQKLFDLTNPQKAIWLTEQFYKGKNINNICGTIFINTAINFEKLQDSINIFIRDNDAFRIHLTIDSIGNPSQYFVEFKPKKFEILNLKSKKMIPDLEFKMVNSHIDLLENDLYKIILFKLPNKTGGIIIVANHIIADACTAGLFANKIINIYSDLINNKEVSEKSTSYINYINSEKKYLSGNTFIKDQAYWENQFEKVPEIGFIPCVSNTNVNSSEAARKVFVLSKSKVALINQFCSSNKISIFNFFMAIYAIYISKVSNLDELIFGTPILNRTSTIEKNTPGMFISTVPIKFNLLTNQTFLEFSSEINKQALGIFRHQKYPYQNILEYIRSKNPEQPNIYDILISYQNTRTNRNSSDIPYKVNWTFNGNCADSMQIHIFDMNDEGSLNIAYDYRLNKYSDEDIEKIHSRILHIMSQIIKSPTSSLTEIDVVTKYEKNMLLNSFNNTHINYNRSSNIISQFERQAVINSNKTALVSNGISFTYKELNEKANQLANHIKSTIDINSNDIIGIMLNRSPEMIIGLLAILKCGAAYLPIDPEYPSERISYMLENSNAKIVLVNNTTEKKLSVNYYKMNISLNSIFYNSKSNMDNPLHNINPNSLAYLIYTSGSTGKPKGVMVKIINLTNFVMGMKKIVKFNKNKVMLSLTTICFDIFGLELWCPLTQGMTLVLANEDEQNILENLNQLCLDNKVNIIQTTPSRFSALLSNDTHLEFLNNITDILVGGEPLNNPLLSRFKELSSARIYNVYGPTETTIWSTVKDMTHSNQITIGKPIANTQCYILGKNLNILPPYTPGELYIGGDGVTAGYLHRKKLTEEKFIFSPFIKNQRIYNTNDLAYYTKKGEIVHLGRSDFQVKIRGYRIELGEIENHILKFFEGINECIVLPVSDNKKLCAYYSGQSTIDPSYAQKELQSILPAYMIPNYFIKLDAFPHTPNGKIDRKHLPLPNAVTVKKIIPPRNFIDNFLIDLLNTELKTNDTSISDSFFEIAGDSLVAISICSHISSKFDIQLTIKEVFENPIISDLSDLIATKTTQNNIDHIVHLKKKEYYTVSAGQKRIYYASKLAGDNSVLYNMPAYIILNKKPDIEKLNKCFKQLLKRHSILRTRFDIVNNTLVQKISDEIDFNINITDEKYSSIEEIVHSFVKPFDLSSSPLIRAYIANFSDKYILLFDMHHIISDGISLSILANDLSKLYNDESLIELKYDFIDFSNYENIKLKNNDYKLSEDFWKNEFAIIPPVLNLPTDKVRPALKRYEGKKIFKNLSSSIVNKIEELCKDLQISPFMFMLSCYYILLSKYTSQNDIVVGTPSTGRTHAEFFNVVGMFVNMLPLRAQIDQNLSFTDFVTEIKSHCINAFENQAYPYDELVSNLNIPHDSSRNPLFDTIFTYQNNGYAPLLFDEIESSYYIPDSNISKYDLSLEVIPSDKDTKLIFEYSTELFKPSTIDAFGEHYLNIINQILEDKTLKLKDVELTSENERQILFDSFNNNTYKYNPYKTLCNMIENQCQKNPDYIAIVFNEKSITYKELNERANSLARYLQKKGITYGDIVGIMLPRSLEVLICMIAVWKCGACYIPIDPNFPKNRITYMLENSNAKILLGFENELNYESFINVRLNNLEVYSENTSNLNLQVDPASPSYIIYTSGSTGKPKGVILNHKALTNLTIYLNNYVDYLKNNHFNMAIASITTISFDIFIFETLISLQKGLKVIMSNEDEQVNSKLLDELIHKYNVKAIQMTPSRMQFFIDNQKLMPNLANLKYITLAGEPLPDKLLTEIKKINEITVYNGYGPSETTVFATFTDVTNYKKINIGKPLPNTQIYILDENKKICPIGVPGEIYIGGDSVGIGYINNPKITSERFLPDFYDNNKVIYKSGDLGKYLPNGEIAYIGRIDNQIKIRGLRIELEEIENLILKFPGVQKTIVTQKQDQNGRKFLIAYLIINSEVLITSLRSYLASNLPRYMLPSYFMILDDFLYLPNGKIDKKSLPLPDLSVFTKGNSYRAPKTKMEEKVSAIFQKLLNIEQISTKDNFFDLGGDSLLAMSLQIELMKISNSITYSDIFMYPTIKDLSNIISKQLKTDKPFYFDEDLEHYNKIIENNNILKIPLIKHDCGNILLTGVTGFVGAHILDSYLTQYPNNKVYCLIRKSPGLSIETKFQNKMHYYFENKYDSLIGKKIILVPGDITKKNLDIDNTLIAELSHNITHVINSAGNFSHFALQEAYSKSNVQGIKNIIEFCKMLNKKLYYISTISVSGMEDLNYPNEYSFKENNFYIKQSINSLYTKSRFESEKLVISAISDGLDAYIIRAGHLTGRAKDYKFLKDIENNAYISRFITFAKLKCVPENLLELNLDFTQIDIFSNALIKLMQYPTNNNRIFHLYNHNYISAQNLLNTVNNIAKIDIVEYDEFIKKLDKSLKVAKNNKLLSTLLSDLRGEKTIKYDSKIKMNSDFTIAYLKNINFTWPKITNDYLINFFEKLLKGE